MTKFEAITEAFQIFIPTAELVLAKYSKSCKNVEVNLSNLIRILSKPEYNLAKELGISSATNSKLMKELFPGRVTSTTGVKPCAYLLSLGDLKYCANCLLVHPIENFRSNKAQRDGVNTYCKECHLEGTKRTQPARQSLYKTSKINRTVPWSELEAIKVFYSQCPQGYHVDHILPLNGTLVSGLHVLSNLQYLLAADNCSKNNRYTPS